MKQAIIKITYTDGSVSYAKQGGIVTSNENEATLYPMRIAKAIVTRSNSYLGERYEVVEAR